MSTNTTNTNNGTSSGASRPKSTKTAGGGEGVLRYPFASFPLPEPELLEKLANEFFLVMPENLGAGNGLASHPPRESEPEEIPTTMFAEETLPFNVAPTVEPGGASAPGSPPSAQPGPLTEDDLRAIASSLAGSFGLLPGGPATLPSPSTNPEPSLPGDSRISPIAVTPTLPAGNDMFSFPLTPTVPPMAPIGTPSGADASAVPSSGIGTQTASSSSTGGPLAGPGSSVTGGGKEGASSPGLVLPPVDELFSFPRVPAFPNAAGLETVPRTMTPSTSPLRGEQTRPEENLGSDAFIAGKETAPSTSDAGYQTGVTKTHGIGVPPTQVPNVRWDELSGGSVPRTNAPTTAYPATASSLPSLGDLFSFPGVPGVQSGPGVPVLPSPSPTIPSSPDPFASGHVVPAASPAGSATIANQNATAPPSDSAVSSAGAAVQPFEFRPDVVPEDLGVSKRPLDPGLIRRDFPILEERVHGRKLVWLDNAATTQKPNAVIDRLSHFYRHENSNIHRAAHDLAARATDAYESAREKARRFLNASTTREIIFVRGTTEGINLVAQAWGRRHVQKDDEIVVTWLEHHANIVPWQQLCAEKGARLRVAPVNDRGEVILEEYEKLLGPRTRIVSFSHVSNALGTITPAREMVEMAHRYGARVLVDGAQAVSHMRVDVQTLNCDFYVFSGHKVFGPTGIGVVFGKLDVLENMPPWQGGGNMIVDVTFEKTTYQSAPARFEAGTGNIADAVGLGAALDYVEQIGMENISAYEHELLNYGTSRLLTVPGLRLIGTAREKAGVLSFVLDNMRTEDVGVALNEEGIAVRSGHHCAQPILRRMGVESTVRPSLAFYNTCEEIDQLVATLLRIQAGRGSV